MNTLKEFAKKLLTNFKSMWPFVANL